MAAVRGLDSTGVGTVAIGYRICVQVGVLSARALSPFVARLLRVAGVADHQFD